MGVNPIETYCDGCDAVDGQCRCEPNCTCDSHCRGKHPLSAVLAAKTVRIDGSDYLVSDPDSWPKEIQGNLYLHGTPIARLPEGLHVGGDLDLGGTPIAQLPHGLQVGGDLYLRSTPITQLPQGLQVEGDLYLGGTPITQLPQGLTVGGDLRLDSLDMEITGTIQIKGDIRVNGEPIPQTSLRPGSLREQVEKLKARDAKKEKFRKSISAYPALARVLAAKPPSDDDLKNALEFMKQSGLVPTGTGKPTKPSRMPPFSVSPAILEDAYYLLADYGTKGDLWIIQENGDSEYLGGFQGTFRPEPGQPVWEDTRSFDYLPLAVIQEILGLLDPEFDDPAATALLAHVVLAAPELKTLKDNKKKLTPEERDAVMKAGAVWHHGPDGEKTPAVWKAEVKGKTWYGCNTHRAYRVAPTLKGAIKEFEFIKTTASVDPVRYPTLARILVNR